MNTSEPNSLKWEQEFEKRWRPLWNVEIKAGESVDLPLGLYDWITAIEEIKVFIANLLSQQKEEFKKMCDGMSRHYVSQPSEYKGSDANVWRQGFNEALTEIITKIDENQKT